jgi:hypothetical protein
VPKDGKTRIGPWLLFGSHDEILGILRWGDVSADELRIHGTSMKCWSVSSVALELPQGRIVSLIGSPRGWPWNGYELRQIKAAGRYPCRKIKFSRSESVMTIAYEKVNAITEDLCSVYGCHRCPGSLKADDSVVLICTHKCIGRSAMRKFG